MFDLDVTAAGQFMGKIEEHSRFLAGIPGIAENRTGAMTGSTLRPVSVHAQSAILAHREGGCGVEAVSGRGGYALPFSGMPDAGCSCCRAKVRSRSRSLMKRQSITAGAARDGMLLMHASSSIRLRVFGRAFPFLA